MLISQMSFEKTFGLSSVFIESTLMENGGVPDAVNPSTLIKEAIHVISCGYEEKTEWGKEVRLKYSCFCTKCTAVCVFKSSFLQLGILGFNFILHYQALKFPSFTFLT